MLKFIFDSTAIKSIAIMYGILMIIIFIGNNIEDEPIKAEAWLPKNDYETEARDKRRSVSRKAQIFNHKQNPWHDDRKEQTENWADFIEELDSRGYSIYDPEAEDIWEEFY